MQVFKRDLQCYRFKVGVVEAVGCEEGQERWGREFERNLNLQEGWKQGVNVGSLQPQLN
jgi:hypothetical protein